MVACAESHETESKSTETESFPSEFARRLAETLESRGITQSEAARQLGFYPSDISRYLGGTTPKLEVLARIVQWMGGDLSKAFPDSTPSTSSGSPLSPSAHLAGGGEVRLPRNGAPNNVDPVNVDASIRHSGRWPLTTGEMFALRVIDDSMGVAYPRGTYVVLRPYKTGAQIPNGTEILVEEPGGRRSLCRFQLVPYTPKPLAIALPISKSDESFLLAQGKAEIVAVELRRIYNHD